MLKFAALMANCLTNNRWKFHQKILSYSENNEIFVRGCFFLPDPVDIYSNSSYLYTVWCGIIIMTIIKFMFVSCKVQSPYMPWNHVTKPTSASTEAAKLLIHVTAMLECSYLRIHSDEWCERTEVSSHFSGPGWAVGLVCFCMLKRWTF